MDPLCSQIAKWKHELFPEQPVVIVHKCWNIAASFVAVVTCGFITFENSGFHQEKSPFFNFVLNESCIMEHGCYM
jgi:hypothetical protein